MANAARVKAGLAEQPIETALETAVRGPKEKQEKLDDLRRSLKDTDTKNGLG
jgi:hypothetical protein